MNSLLMKIKYSLVDFIIILCITILAIVLIL
jgi:hypothetical protein